MRGWPLLQQFLYRPSPARDYVLPPSAHPLYVIAGVGVGWFWLLFIAVPLAAAALAALWLALSLYTGAFIAEIVRGGVQSIVGNDNVQVNVNDARFAKLIGDVQQGIADYYTRQMPKILAKVNSLVAREEYEDAMAALITTWYSAHRSSGGDADPVAEDLLAEVRAEDAAGHARAFRDRWRRAAPLHAERGHRRLPGPARVGR